MHQSVIAITGGNVTIDTLTVDGAGAGDTVVGGNDFHGIGIHNADATVQNVVVTGVRDGGPMGSLTGTQRGRAIFAGVDDGGPHTVTVTGNSVLDYQKNGVDLRGTGLIGIVSNNTITGKGLTGDIAQNGIQCHYAVAEVKAQKDEQARSGEFAKDVPEQKQVPGVGRRAAGQARRLSSPPARTLGTF